MSNKTRSNRHVSFEQAKTIVDFMSQHTEFASGTLRTLEARQTSKKLWHELTNILNASRQGPKKTTDGWSRYWSDFKNKLKNKVTVMNKMKVTSLQSNITPLTKLERRVLTILGPHFTVKKKPNSYIKKFSNHRPPEVKLEAHNESIGNDGNSDSSDVVTEGDKDNSDESLHSFSDNDSNLNGIQGIYPKWLIEVEKKRAEADLIRARAEEQRVSVAAKNAEANLMQAEALKKLADATAIQADAILRIAMAIEKNQTDVLAI